MHDGQFQSEIEKAFSFFWVVTFLVSLIPVSLTLWWAVAHHTTLAGSAIQIFGCAVFVWCWVSMFQCYRVLRQLGLSPEGRKQLFSGPRPDDPDELRAWLSFRRFLLAVLIFIALMIVIPFLP